MNISIIHRGAVHKKNITKVYIFLTDLLHTFFSLQIFKMVFKIYCSYSILIGIIDIGKYIVHTHLHYNFTLYLSVCGLQTHQ